VGISIRFSVILDHLEGGVFFKGVACFFFGHRKIGELNVAELQLPKVGVAFGKNIAMANPHL
jgi:hypothetical protein